MSRINISGKVGNDTEISNAHKVEISTSINGSGNDFFGGADEWPVVYAEVQFQSHEQRRAIDFARKLTKLIRDEFAPTRTTTGREG